MQISHYPLLKVSPQISLPVATADAVATHHQTGLAAITHLAASVTARHDTEIYAQGDSARYCYQVVHGCVRTVKLMEDGRRQVNDFLLPGDWFGFEALETHEFAAEAIGETALRRFPRRAIDALAERDGRVARWMIDLGAGQLRAAREHMVTLGRKTASERIAGFLLETARRLPADRAGTVQLPMSRTDIADHLGLTIETVCRCLAQFRRAGVLRVGRTSFTVLNAPALRALACATRH